MSLASLLLAAGSSGSPLQLPKVEYGAIFPELLLVSGALLLLLISSLTAEKADSRVYALYTVIVGFGAIASTYWMWKDLDDTGPRSAFANAIVYDRFALFFVVAIGSAVVLSALVGESWLRQKRFEGPEFYVLSMLTAAGGMLMAAANDLIVVFLGLEILSIALYVLTGFNRRSGRSREAAVKYFVLGSFSSAVFLYGIALVYGATGTTNLTGIATFLSQNILIERGLLLGGMALLAVGFGFKVAAVPFQQWTPDVYHGAPSPIAGFMAAVSKAAAFAAFLRIFASTFYTLRLDWQPVVLVLAVLSIIVGATVGCVQRNVKRMLAYSSISHAGFILLGLAAANKDGIGGSLYYLLVYTFIVVGSFAIVTIVGGQNENDAGIEAFRGLGIRQPTLGLAFTVLLLAQAGLPLTSGFLAKFYVVSALVENGSYETAVFAMIAAAVAAFFYLRVIVVMFSAPHGAESAGDAMAQPGDVIDGSEPVVQADGTVVAGRPLVAIPAGVWLTLVITVALTVGFGVLPPKLASGIEFARQAAAQLF